MADKTFLSLTYKIAPYLPGCPTETLRQHIRDAARYVCERSLAWRYQIPVYNLLAAVHEYTFDVPSNSEVHAIFGALVNGSPLELLNLDEAIRRYPEWADLFSGETAAELWSETPSAAFNDYTYDESTLDGIEDFVLPDSVVAEASVPAAITQISPDKYIILPLPDGAEDYEMRMFVGLKPRRDATAIDENILDDIETAVLDRAVYMLALMPNTPWSNPELATHKFRVGSYEINSARARANLGNNRGSLSVRPRKWA